MPRQRKKPFWVGMWPKPIGYFESRKNDVPFVSVIALALGLALVSNGFVNLYDAFVFARISTFAGILTLFVALGRLASGRS